MFEQTFKYDDYYEKYISSNDYTSWFKINERYADINDCWVITYSYGFSMSFDNLKITKRFSSEQEATGYIKKILNKFGYKVIDKSLTCFY